MVTKKTKVCCAVAFAGTCLALVVMERRRPFHKGQKVLRPGAFTDLVAYSLLQGGIMALTLGRLLEGLKNGRAFPKVAGFKKLPLAVQVAVFFVVHDFHLYWLHRWQHHNRVMWRTHEVHHGNREIDWLAGSRATPMELVLTEVLKYLPMMVLDASDEAIAIKGTLDAMWGMFIHTNADIRLGPLGAVFYGPEHHRWHHALDVKARGSNFGTKLILWDILFGTKYATKELGPKRLGLPRLPPKSWLAQQASAFRRFSNGP